jgi:Spy/CpxP family protein refolding chaperone
MKKTIVLATMILGAFLIMAFGLAAQEKQQAPELKADTGHMTRNPLDLTAEQQTKLEAMRKAHQAQSQAFLDEMNKLRDEFRSLRDDLKADPKKVAAVVDRMAKVRADRMKAGVQHRREFESILTPEQRAKMARFHDRLREFRGRSLGFGSMPWNRGFGRGFGHGLFQGLRSGFERGFGRFFGRPGIFRPWHDRPIHRHGHGWWRF